jgi:hypothetical protein
MAVVRVARERFDVQHKLPARSTGIGGNDRYFDAELEWRLRLALADALNLWRVEGIKFPAALAGVLRADLHRA